MQIASVEPGVGAYADENTERGIYFYEVFAVDHVGNGSALLEENVGATNYWLGDFNGDGYVSIPDINTLGDTYGVSTGHPFFNAEADVGPTNTGSGTGLPVPDGYVGFDDLVIVGLNFGETTPGQDRA